MTEPTTLTEALAEAGFLDAYLNIRGVQDEAEAMLMMLHDLAALPLGWRLVGPDEVTVTVEALARALGQVEGMLGTKSLTDIARAILAALSADKEVTR